MKFALSMALLGFSINAFCGINRISFQPLDVVSLHEEELLIQKKGEAPRFAISQAVEVSPAIDQNWVHFNNGVSRWSYEFNAPNAVSLNFGFKNFKLSQNAKVFIYSKDRTTFLKTLTAKNNNKFQQYWSPLLMSDHAVIEIEVPTSEIPDTTFTIDHIGQGFRTFSENVKSGNCNIDVQCSESQGWEKEINAVGVISTGGSRFCTGFMVNNTSNDKTPFFMTAHHCEINKETAPSLVVYWNYQSTACGGERDGKLTDYQSGSELLASGSKSDFTLVKLLEKPKAEWNVRYAGWDASGKTPKKSVGIHHPSTDEKSISFDNDSAKISSYLGRTSPGNESHIRIVDWDLGTTEPGSSGSPLFDENHRVVGQLHGGSAACDNDESDYYGRFSMSWSGDGKSSGSLKPHLDSAKTGKKQTNTI